MWVDLVGRVLEVAGITGFLGNLGTTQATLDEGLDASMALEAGKVIRPKIAEKLGMSHAS